MKMNRREKWEKLLKENGYVLEFDKLVTDDLESWQNVPFAIKENFKFPLAYTYQRLRRYKGRRRCLIDWNNILPSLENLRILEKKYMGKCPYMKVIFISRKSCYLME